MNSTHCVQYFFSEHFCQIFKVQLIYILIQVFVCPIGILVGLFLTAFFFNASLFLLLSSIFCRIFVNTLQNSVLHAFRTILVSSPLLLEVFREEGIWDLIFSENFFYFGPASEGSSIECCTYNEGSLSNSEIYASNYTDCQGKAVGVEILQMEVISFVEFAATFSGSAHNLVGLLLYPL